MKFNTNSNTYTILYASGMVIVVAFLLAFVSSALKSLSEANERIDTKKQILASLNIRDISNDQVESDYQQHIVADLVVNAKGKVIKNGQAKDQDGFKISRKEFSDEQLPLFVCTVDGKKKYVLPVVGKGLWGGIWGYLALNDDCRTIYGAYFSHESETAGLGALIKEEKFQNEFKNKQILNENGTIALSVVKHGNVKNATTQVDGISSATLTINGVDAMLKEYLGKYLPYLNSQKQ